MGYMGKKYCYDIVHEAQTKVHKIRAITQDCKLLINNEIQKINNDMDDRFLKAYGGDQG